ncbi:uncharacterized protein [Clytia hemisphaerica]|uniref:Uncharacterized protein n=1 Tax=Clytia hemisphaerica TaxID=252671 RepID=A0A7M5XAS7_9CNID|eukprot:TCONS_00003728-protein
MKTLSVIILLSILGIKQCSSIKKELLDKIVDDVTDKILSDLEEFNGLDIDNDENEEDEDDDVMMEVENDENEDLTPKRRKADPWLRVPPIRIRIPVNHPRPHNCQIHRDQCGRFKNGCGPQFYTKYLGGKNFLPHESTFTQACNKHDSCFDCSNEHGWTQKQCDDRFLQDMIKKCKCNYYKWYHTIKRGDCIAWAHVFYGAVRAGGHQFIEPHNINQNCYRQCMIPLASPHVEVTE